MAPLPISQRKGDYVHAMIFVIYGLIAVTMDSVNVIGPVGGITRETAQLGGVWPPDFVVEAFFFWGQYDPLLQANPFWLKVMCTLSPLVYMPFYFFAVYAILKGREWIRVPMMMFAWGMFYSVTVILVVALYGEDHLRSPRPDLIFAAYGAYWLYPVYLMYRFASPTPFGSTKNKVKSK